MKYVFLLTFLLLFACGEPKKSEVKPEGEKTEAKPEEGKTDSEKISSLDELVYEGRGHSRLKNESAARGNAEVQGRVMLIKALTEEAVLLVTKFSSENKGYFNDGLNMESFSKVIQDNFKKATTLKGSSVSEYSTNKDTTFANVEIPLMNGYEIIEQTVVEAGTEGKFIKDGQADAFKKVFREFFIAEKKKLLTQPA